MPGRVIVIGLDAFEPTVALGLISMGRLPNLARLAARSGRFQLDHGPERYTGLAWHQFATGLRPQQSGMWSAVRFDPGTYSVAQPDMDAPPFTHDLGVRTVAFDVPHFNLAADRSLSGVSNWGCHDAGVPRATRPDELWAELVTRFGPYPADEHIYGITWSDPEQTRRMGLELVAAVEARRRICRWLLAERIPEWDLAVLAIAEFHSVIETMWHGWDETHPLHEAPSAPAAREAFIAVYEAGDRLVGDLLDAFPDATFLVFAPHGMGKNHADVPGMILLPELMHRYSLGSAAFMPGFAMDPVADTRQDLSKTDWSGWVNGRLSFTNLPAPQARGWLPSILRRQAQQPPAFDQPLDWMPAARYRFLWPRMKAFGIPAYHDARIRLNVKGREARGIVAPRQYRSTLEEIAAVIRSSAEIPSGRPIDVAVEFTSPEDPFAVGPWQTDIVVRFNRNVLGVLHPVLGPVGPVPHRRTGGHTGGYGLAWVAGDGIAPGNYGVVSTFDLVPCIRDLALRRVPKSEIGNALASRSGPASSAASGN